MDLQEGLESCEKIILVGESFFIFFIVWSSTDLMVEISVSVVSMEEDVYSYHQTMGFVLSEFVSFWVFHLLVKLNKTLFDFLNVIVKLNERKEGLGTDLSNKVSSTLCISFEKINELVHALLSWFL